MIKLIKKLYLIIIFFSAFGLLLNCSEKLVNQSPSIPLNIVPANNDTNVSVICKLIWTPCYDTEDEDATYEIWYAPYTLQGPNIGNWTDACYEPGPLKPYTKYYWRIVANDPGNNSAISEIWTFTTGAPLGNLNILVADYTQTHYYGGAEVFLYLSVEMMTADNQRLYYYGKLFTDSLYPTVNGALFENLIKQKYYYFARKVFGGGNFKQETGESFVPLGDTTTVICLVN